MISRIEIPQSRQVFVVALDIDVGALKSPAGAQDHAHALRHVEVAQDLLHPLAIGRIGDLARDAAATTGVGHQHAIAAGGGEVGGEGSALVAALFLDDLHQQDLPALETSWILYWRIGLRRRRSRVSRSSISSSPPSVLDRDVGLRRRQIGRGSPLISADCSVPSAAAIVSPSAGSDAGAVSGFRRALDSAGVAR